MLSYQHIYHAGNMADVQKHLWLIYVLDYLTKKDKPFIWLDTHAGRGLYDLESHEAQKIKEYESGIDLFLNKIEKIDDLPAPIKTYKKIIANLNGDKKSITTYPGSAYLAAKIMRPTDKLYAYDLHKGEFPYLEHTLKNYINSSVRFEDGLEGLKSLIPHTTLKRGGVLIDPSYELKDDYINIAAAAIEAYKKWPQGIYMIWYPILEKAMHIDMLASLKELNLSNEDFVIDEWHYPNAAKGMKGTGMAIINPPFGSIETMHEIRNLVL